MPQDYARMFLKFLEKMAREQKFDANDTAYMGTQFGNVVETITTKSQMLKFIEDFIEDYPELEELKDEINNLT